MFRTMCFGMLMISSLTSNTVVAEVVTFGSGANTFTMEFVTIGNAGNRSDTTGSPSPAGSVPYVYQMAKHEVSEAMIESFNASQSLLITKTTRGAHKPATSITWNEAARFVNWLNTSSGGSVAYKFGTGNLNDDTTPWTVADPLDYNPSNPYRSIRAMYALPTIDEWYKAAYYDPLGDTGAGVYYNYPTGSDSVPTAVSSGTMANTAVYNGQAVPADITDAGGLTPYGIMGMAGNVSEAIERAPGGGYFLTRGGSWAEIPNQMSTTPYNLPPFPAWYEWETNGIRVVRVGETYTQAVPEPQTILLLLVVIVAIANKHLRQKLNEAKSLG